jgi:hypothetical protein
VSTFPGQALAVGPGVVGEDVFDACDAVCVEEGGHAGEKACQVRGLLVRVDLAVGEAGVIVDGGVDVVEAHGADRPTGVTAADLVAAVVGDAAELPHIDVNQFAGDGRSWVIHLGRRD